MTSLYTKRATRISKISSEMMWMTFRSGQQTITRAWTPAKPKNFWFTLEEWSWASLVLLSMVTRLTDYVCQVWSTALTSEQSHAVETIQRRAMQTISPHKANEEALHEHRYSHPAATTEWTVYVIDFLKTYVTLVIGSTIFYHSSTTLVIS